MVGGAMMTLETVLVVTYRATPRTTDRGIARIETEVERRIGAEEDDD